MVYQWNVKMQEDAQQVGELCEELKNTVGLSPQTLLDASRSEDALLHNEFEWDDEVAAEKYRLKQAQGIIVNLKVIPTEKEEPTRAFEVIDHSYGKSSGYESVVDVMSDDEKRQRLLASAKQELSWFREKYKTLKELAEVMKAIDEVCD